MNRRKLKKTKNKNVRITKKKRKNNCKNKKMNKSNRKRRGDEWRIKKSAGLLFNSP